MNSFRRESLALKDQEANYDSHNIQGIPRLNKEVGQAHPTPQSQPLSIGMTFFSVIIHIIYTFTL